MSNALPGRLLIENVAGFEVLYNPPSAFCFLLSLDQKTSLTRQTLLTALSRLGYSVIELLLTPLAFGIPNSRLRYYLLARFEPFTFSGGTPAAGILRYIPGRGTDWLDDRNQLEVMPGATAVRDYLDPPGSSLADCTIPPRVLEKWGRLFDIVLPTSYRTCCFTRGSWVPPQVWYVL